MASLAETLPPLIAAAQASRDRLLQTAATPGANGRACRKAATIATALINGARVALASGDPARLRVAHDNLKGYADE